MHITFSKGLHKRKFKHRRMNDRRVNETTNQNVEQIVLGRKFLMQILRDSKRFFEQIHIYEKFYSISISND